jgi:hypothetical protein
MTRIERGRRTTKQHGEFVIPGMTLTGPERNRRSEERKVAGWFDATQRANLPSFQQGPYPMPQLLHA